MIKIEGGHFVGEPTERPTHSPRGHEIDYFESEEDMEDALTTERRRERSRQDKYDNLRGYIRFWAVGAGPRSRRSELEFHRLLACWSECPGCGNCRCRQPIDGGWARCRCAEGKKQLSPYRIVFLNNAEKRDWATRIWWIGHGWVPKEEQALKTTVGARGLD